MFVLIKAGYGEFLGDCEVLGTYGDLGKAEEAIAEAAWGLWPDADGSCDEPVHNELDADGLPCFYDDDGHEWRVFEVKEPEPKLNPNVAETVSYECKNDPTFRKGVLLHQATVRWNSGKSFEEHAPQRVELRVGGKSYEYKAV